MARPLKPFVRGGGYYPSRRWTPLVYSGGYTTMHDEGEQPVPIPWATFTGNPLEFDAPKAHALKSCVVSIEPIQSGSGDPSPDNVRPISGWTEAKLWGTGENLIDIGSPEKDGYYNANGVYSGATTYSCYKVPVCPNTKYTITGNFAGIITYWDKDLNFISGVNQGAGVSKTFTTPANCVYFRKSILKTDIDGTQMLVFGDSLPSYSPYTGTSLTISFGQTVYGGTASYEGNGIWRITPFPEYDSYNGETLVGPWQSSIDKYVAGTSPTIGAQVVDKGGADPSFTVTTAELFDALAGRNVMWTDCANLTVEAKGTAVELNALQSLNLLLGNRYVNNHTEDDVSDDEALDILLGGNTR